MKCHLCLFVVLAIGVGSATAQGPANTDLYPLKKGNRWVYKAIDSVDKEPRKVVVEAEREEPYSRKVKKDKGEVVENYVGYLIKATSGGREVKGAGITGGKSTVDHVVVVPNEGIYRVHTAGTPATPPILFLKLPPKVGDTWQCDSMSGNAAIKGTFTTKADKIGNFDAFVVLYRDANSGVEIDYWFVSGIGMIRQRVKTKNTEVVLQLEEYTLVK